MFSHEQYWALRGRGGVVDRRGRGRLELIGADRLGYLQGLLTNDVAALTAGTGCYAALLTPQGRMVTDMRVSELGDRVLLDLPASTTEAVRQRLADFIFTEDVEVRDVTAALAQFGLYGPQAAVILSRATAGTERQRLESLEADRSISLIFDGTPVTVVRSSDYGVPGFELFVDSSRGDDLVRAVRSGGASPIGPETVDVTRIEAGRPEFGVDMDEHTIPLEAGIENRAISLTKGCYVGQEIIIRVLHRGGGRVARHLVGLAADTDPAALQRGERLQADGRAVGVVTSAGFSPALGRAIGLGYVHRDWTEPGTVLGVGEMSARVATVAAVPFTLPKTASG
jgi:folate-binding protein YgfZ